MEKHWLTLYIDSNCELTFINLTRKKDLVALTRYGNLNIIYSSYKKFNFRCRILWYLTKWYTSFSYDDTFWKYVTVFKNISLFNLIQVSITITVCMVLCIKSEISKLSMKHDIKETIFYEMHYPLCINKTNYNTQLWDILNLVL